MTAHSYILHGTLIAGWLALAVWAALRAVRGHRWGWMLFALGFTMAAGSRILILAATMGYTSWRRWETMALPIGMMLCVTIGMKMTSHEKDCRSCILFQNEQKELS